MNFDETLKQFETNLISFANTVLEAIQKQDRELKEISQRLSALEERLEEHIGRK